MRAAAPAQDRLAHIYRIGGLDDAAQRRIDAARWRGPAPRQQQIVEARAVDVVAEDRGASGVVDVKIGDLGAVRQRDCVASATGVGQPRRGLAAARRSGAEQLLPILQPDAAVERRAAFRRRKHGDRGTRGRAALDVGQRGERTRVRAGTVSRSAGPDEPSSLIAVARAVDRGLGHRHGRPEQGVGTSDPEHQQPGHGKTRASYPNAGQGRCLAVNRERRDAPPSPRLTLIELTAASRAAAGTDCRGREGGVKAARRHPRARAR